jgi:hypothetical protein
MDGLFGFGGCKTLIFGDMAVHGMEAARLHTSKPRPLAGPPAVVSKSGCGEGLTASYRHTDQNV